MAENPTWESSEDLTPSWESTTDIEVADTPYSTTESDILGGMSERERKRLDLLSQQAAAQQEARSLDRRLEGFDFLEGGLASPETARMALEVGGGGFLPEGVKQSLSQTGSGLTSPLNLAMLGVGGGAGAIPKVGGAVTRGIAGGFAVDMGRHIPEAAQAAGEASVVGTPEEKQKAYTDLATMLAMTGAAGRGAVGPIPTPQPPRLAEFPALADPNIVAVNRMAPGTVGRAAERMEMAPPRIEPPVGIFEAGNVPFDRMRRFGGPIPPIEFIDVPVKVEVPRGELGAGGKVSFAAEAPVLLRNAVEKAESSGLTRSAEALKVADRRAVPQERALAPEPAAVLPDAKAAQAPVADFSPVKTTENAWDFGRARQTPEGIAEIEAIKDGITQELAALRANKALEPAERLNRLSDVATRSQLATEALQAAKNVTDRPAMTEYFNRQALEPAKPVGEVGALADQVSAMDAESFRAWAQQQEGGVTTSAYNYGKTVTTPEGIARLKELEAASEAKATQLLDAGDIDAGVAETTKKQFFTEAIESAVGVAENKSSLTTAEVAQAKASGQPSQPSLFREASAMDVDSYVNPATSATTPYGIPEINVATSRDLAIGQRGGRSGITVEFDPTGLEVRNPRTRKPGAGFVEESGGGAEKVIRAQAPALRKNVRSITIPNNAPRDASLIRLKRFLNDEWVAEKTDTGTVYRPKQSTASTDIIAKLESLKTDPGNAGKLFSLPHPDAIKAIAKQTWNDALDLAIAAVKAGRSVKDAVEAAMQYLRKNVKGISESQVRDNLNYVVSNEAKPKAEAPVPAAGQAAPPSAVPAKTAPGVKVSLDDIYSIFELPQKPSPTVKQRVIQASEAFRTGVSSSFRPLNKLAEDISKSYGRNNPKDVAGIFEQLKGSSGKAEADVYRFDQDVSKSVKGSEKDFNAYTFLRRTLDRLNQDAADAAAGKPVRRSVAGYTIPDITSKLAELETRLGPDKTAKFQNAADQYQQHMDQALRLQVESGRMSPEVYQSIKEGNQFYAPFKVMKYLEESSRLEGTGKRIDTAADYVKAMEGIESTDFKLGDMLAAARQNITISRILAEKNQAMRNISDLAGLDLRGDFIRKLNQGERPPQGMESVKVFENGDPVNYAVAPEVAEAVQIQGNAGNILARIGGNTFRVGATTLNVPFQVSNLMADAPRAALVSRYGVRGVADLVNYPLGFIEALHSSIAGNVFGVKSLEGKGLLDTIGGTISPEFGATQKTAPSNLYLDFLDSGAAGTTVQKYLTPKALEFRPESTGSRAGAIAKNTLNTVPRLADAIEQTSKILGIKRAMKFEGVQSGKQLAREIPEAVTEVRRFSGSPDFGRMGKWVDQYRLNLLYMFLNARIQGTVADVGRLTGRDGGKAARRTWLGVGAAVGLPTLYNYILNHSDKNAADYAQRPEQEKENYWLIPKDSYITDSSGNKVRDYWRIPKREISKWTANAVESGLDFAREKDPEAFWKWAGGMAEDVVPISIKGDNLQERMESAASGLHPFIKAPIEIGSGRDLYRHKDIVPDSMKKASPELQYTDRTAKAFVDLANAMPDVAPEVFRSPLMLEKGVQDLTAGLFTQFLPKKPVEGRSAIENNPLLQRFQSLPFTDSTEFDERMKTMEREAADVQLTRFRKADEFLKANKGQSVDAMNAKLQALRADPRLVARIIDLMTAEKRGIDQQDRRILNLPVQQRAQFILDELGKSTPEKKAELIREYGQKRILTRDVAEEMNRLTQPSR